MVIPNAIRIYMNNGHDILFGSFIERDPCYNMLATSIEAEKHYSLIKAEVLHRTACDACDSESCRPAIPSAAEASSSVSESTSTSDESDRNDGNDKDVDVERERRRTMSCVECDPSPMEFHLRDVASSEDLVSLDSSSLRRPSSTDDASVARKSPGPQLVFLRPDI